MTTTALDKFLAGITAAARTFAEDIRNQHTQSAENARASLAKQAEEMKELQKKMDTILSSHERLKNDLGGSISETKTENSSSQEEAPRARGRPRKRKASEISQPTESSSVAVKVKIMKICDVNVRVTQMSNGDVLVVLADLMNVAAIAYSSLTNIIYSTSTNKVRHNLEEGDFHKIKCGKNSDGRPSVVQKIYAVTIDGARKILISMNKSAKDDTRRDAIRGALDKLPNMFAAFDD
jgi:ribosomal protein L16 Arg81 hydroxylase